MARSRITTFIVDGADFFAAHLANGGARIGMVGGLMLEVLPMHTEHLEKIRACKTEQDVDSLLDHFIESGVVLLG